jgi:hypothetical protein
MRQSLRPAFLKPILLHFLYLVGSKGSDENWCSTAMPRPRYRACLEDGLKLDLNHLARKGFIKFGANIGARGISWSNSHQGEIASGAITADITDPSHAWFRIATGGFAQQVTLVSRPRHYGGCQWFFVCPVTGGLATVLWKPPGASRFCSRQAWGRQVAYHGKESRLTRDLEDLKQKIGVPSGALPACFDAAFGLEITDEVEGEAADDGHVLGAVAGAVSR